MAGRQTTKQAEQPTIPPLPIPGGQDPRANKQLGIGSIWAARDGTGQGGGGRGAEEAKGAIKPGAWTRGSRGIGGRAKVPGPASPSRPQPNKTPTSTLHYYQPGCLDPPPKLGCDPLRNSPLHVQNTSPRRAGGRRASLGCGRAVRFLPWPCLTWRWPGVLGVLAFWHCICIGNAWARPLSHRRAISSAPRRPLIGFPTGGTPSPPFVTHRTIQHSIHHHQVLRVYESMTDRGPVPSPPAPCCLRLGLGLSLRQSMPTETGRTTTHSLTHSRRASQK